MFPVPVPPPEEQREIVRLLESAATWVDTLEQEVVDGVERATSLRQFNPKCGFEGRLVLQNSNDKPAADLLDARAGMHDIGAAAVTRLGAHAFLFARDDPQTWTAYEHLFEHLRWSPAVEHGMPDFDLRWRLSMVGALAGGNDARFRGTARPRLRHMAMAL